MIRFVCAFGLSLFIAFTPPANTPIDGNQGISIADTRFKYGGIASPLESYYDSLLATYGNLDNYHEENYIYNNGQHGISNYNGMLSHIIKDLDGDLIPEMITFRMYTEFLDEFSNKTIVMEVYHMTNGIVGLSDSLNISSEQYIGEELECLVSTKYVGDNLRIFLNYFEKKVLEEYYENKFVALEYTGNINVITELNLSGNEDDYDGSYEFRDDVIDAGVDLVDDYDIYNKAFLNDDIAMNPVFSIKRFNEKVKEGYIEDYVEQHPDEFDDDGLIRVRYGYTIFTDREVKA